MESYVPFQEITPQALTMHHIIWLCPENNDLNVPEIYIFSYKKIKFRLRKRSTFIFMIWLYIKMIKFCLHEKQNDPFKGALSDLFISYLSAIYWIF